MKGQNDFVLHLHVCKDEKIQESRHRRKRGKTCFLRRPRKELSAYLLNFDRLKWVLNKNPAEDKIEKQALTLLDSVGPIIYILEPILKQSSRSKLGTLSKSGTLMKLMNFGKCKCLICSLPTCEPLLVGRSRVVGRDPETSSMNHSGAKHLKILACI